MLVTVAPRLAPVASNGITHKNNVAWLELQGGGNLVA